MATIVRTGLGDIRGVAGDGVIAFRGVPYGRQVRFSAPEPMEAWAGVLDATRHGPIAPQGPSRLRAAMGDYAHPQSEDCLTLTINTPSVSGKRPVLVWLHGGAWMSGAGSLDMYDGSVLARDGDMVVVGVNYRLGALGYLFHPALGAANPGSLDQALALRWVHAHIAAFGGDPDCVTLCGQSAGATSIGRLILEPDVRRLFHRVILQSGSFGRPPLERGEAARRAELVMRHLGIDPAAPDVAARMAAVPVAEVLAAQGVLARSLAVWGESTPPYMPVVEEGCSEAALTGRIAAAAEGLDVLIGVTREEVHAFYVADPAMAGVDPAAVRARMGERLGYYQARRPGGSDLDWLADMASDDVFIQPSLRLADALTGRVFAYRFDYAPAGNRFRACHCAELPFVFGTFSAFGGAGMLEGADLAFCAALSARMRGEWARFVHDGATSWAGYGSDRLAMRFDGVCEVAGFQVLEGTSA